jgi:hypothetical protein
MAYLSDPPAKPAQLRGGGTYTGNQQFADRATGLRNCFACNKFRPMAGGRIHPRKRIWNCAGCVANWLPAK